MFIYSPLCIINVRFCSVVLKLREECHCMDLSSHTDYNKLIRVWAKFWLKLKVTKCLAFLLIKMFYSHYFMVFTNTIK